MATEILTHKLWDNPEGLILVEEGRYPYLRAIQDVVKKTFQAHVSPDARVLEVGAGLGLLGSLVPLEYRDRYITTDYSLANLREGLRRRNFNAVATLAQNLPFPDASFNCVVDLDAYDTIPKLDEVFSEVRRVLSVGGMFIHFQVNRPSDDTVWNDFPEYTFFPPRANQARDFQTITGLKTSELGKRIHMAPSSFQGILQDFIDNQIGAYTEVLAANDVNHVTSAINDVLEILPVERVVIPSLFDYFRAKLEAQARTNGLSVVQSGLVGSVIRGHRTEKQHPAYNTFFMEQGIGMDNKNLGLMLERSEDVVEKASILVFVAQKT